MHVYTRIRDSSLCLARFHLMQMKRRGPRPLFSRTQVPNVVLGWARSCACSLTCLTVG